ncbi:FAD-dependent oxidoreductase, partial [Escherichia coli]|uniref:FAD-dependent oxidoreductase n=1 Tax=Escherichia coli TaxID=562 RepID=UPI0020264EEE
HDNAACFQYRARSCFNLMQAAFNRCRDQFARALTVDHINVVFINMNFQRTCQFLAFGLRYRNVVFDINGIEDLTTKTFAHQTGAKWRNMNVPGEDQYRTKGVTYCPHCDGPLFKGKRVAVIGGGNSGVEAAIDLAGIVEHVTLLEFAPEMKADQVLQDKLRSLKNVDIILNAQTTEVKGDGSKVVGLEYRDRVSGDIHNIELAGIFVQIGLLPNTNWLEGAVERNRMGEIIIDAKCETNVKGVFAAGDCTTVPYKQIIIATGEGAKASLSAFDYLIRTKTA